MGGRGDGQPVAGRVEPDGPERGGDGREPGVERGQTGGVEPQAVDPLGRHALGHGPADHVPRGQLVDEALPVGVPQQGPVARAAPRTAAGRGMAGWWSAVGWNCMNSTSATGTPARRAMARPSAVASAGLVVTANSWPAPPVASTVWVARTSTRPTLGAEGHDAPAPPALHQQVEGEPLLQHGGGRGPGGVDQGPLDLGPGGRTAGVDHPGRRVAALAGQGQGPAGLAVEDRAHGDELVDPGRALVHQHPHRVGVAQTGPGGQGVGQVEVGRVLVPARAPRPRRPGPSGWPTGTARPWSARPTRRPAVRPPARPPVGDSGAASRTAADRPATPLPRTRTSRATGATSDRPAADATSGSATARSVAPTGVEVVDQPHRADGGGHDQPQRARRWPTTGPARGRRR